MDLNRVRLSARANDSRTKYFCIVSLLLCSTCFTVAVAVHADVSASTLKELSLEELLNIEVTSVSKTEETLGTAAAAIAVITNEDIRRFGATSVPEALRLAPGLHVARHSSNIWAVSSRGFSSVSSEKLLVLTDTRSIYTPLFSGVFWDVQNYLLQDIDRIEVIRGPGAALWGSNAVNGVINITTKPAQGTQGLYLEAGTGTEERATVGARFGGQTRNGIYYRVFGKYVERDASFNSTPLTSDDWRLGHVGFRADWDASDADAVTFQAEAYHGDIGQLAPSLAVGTRPGPTGDLEVGVSGGNVLGRWRHRIDPDSDLQFRAYYDRTRRDDPTYTDALDTVDLDFQHRFSATSRQQIIWGLNYRLMASRVEGRGIFAPGLDPSSTHDQLLSAFVQDRVSVHDSLHVTIGTKVEHNDYSGFEFQPSVRASWDFVPDQTLWSAVSRAVRVPTRLERDVSINASDPAGNPVVRLLGNAAFDSEELTAYELGYRWQALASVAIDLAAFYNRYQGLASLEQGQPFIEGSRLIVPVVNRNLTDGRAEGMEALVTYSPVHFWRLSASYSYIDLSLDPGGRDLGQARFVEGSTPRHQFGLRSFLDLPAGFQIDAQLRRLSAVRTTPLVTRPPATPQYSDLDLRLAWHGMGRVEVSLVGQNLLHKHHAEFAAPFGSGEIERSVYGKITWGF